MSDKGDKTKIYEVFPDCYGKFSKYGSEACVNCECFDDCSSLDRLLE